MSLLDKIKVSADIKKLSVAELPALAKEIRQLILDTVLKNGGHLASSLGAVEIILAMHYVFDPPADKFIFDVGHQCYAHKIITGRRDSFHTLRQLGGISGFPKRSESEYDAADTGHSSTAIAVGTGLSKAHVLSDLKNTVVSLVGDGAMTGGLSYEALNFSDRAGGKQIVILNDNNMSIEKNVGQLANYFVKLHANSRYRRVKSGIKTFVSELKIASVKKSSYLLTKIKNSVKYFVQNGMPFEQYGFAYFGPIDGHDFNALIDAMSVAKKSDENTIIHAVTVKGKGYKKAEENPRKYHGYSVGGVSGGESFSEVFGTHLADLAEKNQKIVAVTAAMTDGTGLGTFSVRHPKRTVDVGIAEAQGMAFSAGLALAGFKPYFAVYSSFLQRAYDQIIHDVCLPNLPVTVCIDRAGIIPADGETHQGIYDVSALRAIPNMHIVCPKDTEELKKTLDFSLNFNAPLAIRYPKGSCKTVSAGIETFNPFKYEILKEGKDVTVLACGATMVREALRALDFLKVSACVVNARSVKPLDEEFLSKLSGNVVTLEDNQTAGGFGSAVAEFYAKMNKKGVSLHIFGIENDLLTHGTVQELLERTGLSAKIIAKRIDKICANG